MEKDGFMERPWKIIIVEDDESVQISLEAHFEDNGFFVVKTDTAEDALKMMETERPDAAIIDLRLPGMGGEALIRRLQELFPNTVCVIYTGSVEFYVPKDIKEMQGVSETVFFKPVDDLNLISNEVTRLLKAVNNPREEDD